MKEKKKCQLCGLLIDSDIETCPYCGYKQTEEKNEEKKIDVTPPNEENKKEEKKNGLHFFPTREVKVSLAKNISFFAIGYLGLNIIALIFSLIGKSLNRYFMTTIEGSGIINFACYFILFGIMLLIFWKDIHKVLVEFKKLDTWLIGFSYGILLMFVSSIINYITVTLNPGLGTNVNEASIESILTVFPALSLIVFGIIGPICEEFTYRVGLFSLTSRVSRWLPYIVVPIVFGFIHFDYQSSDLTTELLNIPSYIVAGLLLSYFYDKGGIGASIIAHVTNNMISLIISLI
jgi:membrane protease YdiL (CAAX protease family)